jgi:hypothetical protein
MKSFLPFFFLLLVLASCNKTDDPVPQPPGFRLTVENSFNQLEGEVAVYLSDETGAVRDFRTVPALDSVQLVVPEAGTGDRFDCTVVRIVTLASSATGLLDTTVNLTTYTGLADGETVRLRNLEYRQATDLFVNFTGINTLDTIIVPDGLTFIKPQVSNNFSGHFRVLHTGQFWIRFKHDGDPFWRYVLLENINAPTVNITLNPQVLPHILSPFHPIQLPFAAPWAYQVDGVIDTVTLDFLALGDLIRAPGGPVPVFSMIEIIEPLLTDQVDPLPLPYHSFRVRFSGRSPAADGYTLIHDGFYPEVPPTIEEPDFNLIPTTLTGNRLAAVRCVGSFDLVAITRFHAGVPNLTWEVLLPPAAEDIVTQRLPDVPKSLADRFPDLRNYNFGGGVRARAESYLSLDGYEAVVRQRLNAHDPLWQPRAHYTAIEKNF